MFCKNIASLAVAREHHGAVTWAERDTTEHHLESNLLQLSYSMFCKNIASLAVAREHHRVVTHSYAP